MKVVKLQLFKGVMTYTASGAIATENETIKLPHGDAEWKNFKSNILAFGYTSAKVLTVIDASQKELKNATAQLAKIKSLSKTSLTEINEWDDKIATLREVPLPEMVEEIPSIQNEVNGWFVAEKAETKNESNSELVDALKKQNELLMKRLDALEKPASTPSNTTDDTTEPDVELEALRAKFFELKGKKAHKNLDAATLKEAIETHQAN